MKKNRMSQFWLKMVPVLLGLVIGLGASILLEGTEKGIKAENVVTAVAMGVIIFEFFEGQWARKTNCFLAATAAGVAIREYTGMSMKTIFVITFVTILVTVIVQAVKGAKTAVSNSSPNQTNQANQKAPQRY